MQSARERELEEEVNRLRIANRRLQVEGPALERDKLVIELRSKIAELEEEVNRLKWRDQIETQILPVRISQKKRDVCDWCKMGVERIHSEDTR